MWRSGGGNRGKKESTGLVVVAVDTTDKGSQHALKWAADHLISKDQIFHLLHVRKKVTTITTPTGQQLQLDQVDEDVASTYFCELDTRTRELLLPFQCFCNRRGLQCKEVILDEVEIPKAIIDYLVHQSVDKLVLGASSRNAFMRTFKQADVPTSVSKLAPDFCSIYVIAKGKISSIRPAPNPNKNKATKETNRKFEAAGNPYQSVKSDPIASKQVEISMSSKMGYGQDGSVGARGHEQMKDERNSRIGQGGGGYNDFLNYSVSSCPSPSRSSTDHSPYPFAREHMGGAARPSRMSNQWYDDSHNEEVRWSSESSKSGGSNFSKGSGGNRYSSPRAEAFSGSSTEDMDAEMRRLKLQLKQTRDMCSNALMEAVSAKQARDLYSWKPAEELKFSSGETFGEIRERPKNSELKGANPMTELERTTGDSVGKNLLAEQNKKILDALAANYKYRVYSLEEIEKATDNFSDALKIGEGGYGPVFKATLDHSLVAIKILRSDAAQGMKQFQQEIEVLSSIRHPNMVLLMGACPEYGCLVYEYMSNGSLEDCLFRQNNSPPLSWQLRFKIAAEIATGLLFLHQNKPEPLVHRDLKPGNILLDHNFVSKIADVGLARLLPPSLANAVTQYRMTAAAGTFCYIDPEYQKTGMLGIKSDIYALGIIFLQLITAKPPMGLAHKLENSMEVGSFEEMLDPTVPDWPMEETIKFAHLALKCAELRRRDRPDLASVIVPELNRLMALADMTPPNAKNLLHANTWHRQDVPSLDSSEFSNDSSMGKAAYSVSTIMGPTIGSFLQ